MEIKKTKDYSIFKKMKGNREPLKGNIRKLTRSIQKENNLAFHPIIVNKNMEVVDGQHRLIVAESLGLEIYWIQQEGDCDNHLVLSNANQFKWNPQDFITFFKEREGGEHYRKFHEICEKYGYPPQPLVIFMWGSNYDKQMDKIREGTYKMPETEDYLDLIDAHQKFLEILRTHEVKPFYRFIKTSAVAAFRRFILNKQVDLQEFLERADRRWFDIRPQASINEWYAMYVDIYNFNRRNRISGGSKYYLKENIDE